MNDPRRAPALGDADTPGWKGILAPGEVILWQGAPRQAFYWRGDYNRGIVAALILVIVPWLVGVDDPMRTILLLIAPLFAFARPVRDAVRRHFSFYTLTDRRGFFGTDMPLLGRRLDSHPLSSTAPELETGAQGAAVYFATVTRDTKNGPITQRVGFEGLDPDDARQVADLIRSHARADA